MDKRGSYAVWFIVLAVVVAVMLALFFVFDSEPLKNILLVLIILVIIFGFGLLTGLYFHRINKLRRRLRELTSLVQEEEPETLRDKYLVIYNTYMKLSEKQKRNFYGKISKIREAMEEQMQAEKDIQSLLPKAEKAKIKQKKELYQKAHLCYQKLPVKVQHRYYDKISALKGELERGK